MTAAHQTLQDAVAAILDDVEPNENPYFVALRERAFDKDDFVETQIQFYYAVTFFSRPMAAVAAKIPSARMRVEVLRNVWEEHGEGDARAMHGETFKLLLERLAECGIDEIESRALWPELRAFNTALIGCCVLDDWEIGTSCLGMIERMFAEISAWIGNGIVANGWLSRDRLVHYALHEELDVRHSDDFFAVLTPVWDRGERERYLIRQGLQLGAYVFDELYRGLHRARQRRALAPVRLPQDRVYAG
jgi:pyrroloquinoline-quinone synthase